MAVAARPIPTAKPRRLVGVQDTATAVARLVAVACLVVIRRRSPAREAVDVPAPATGLVITTHLLAPTRDVLVVVAAVVIRLVMTFLGLEASLTMETATAVPMEVVPVAAAADAAPTLGLTTLMAVLRAIATLTPIATTIPLGPVRQGPLGRLLARPFILENLHAARADGLLGQAVVVVPPVPAPVAVEAAITTWVVRTTSTVRAPLDVVMEQLVTAEAWRAVHALDAALARSATVSQLAGLREPIMTRSNTVADAVILATVTTTHAILAVALGLLTVPTLAKVPVTAPVAATSRPIRAPAGIVTTPMVVVPFPLAAPTVPVVALVTVEVRLVRNPPQLGAVLLGELGPTLGDATRLLVVPTAISWIVVRSATPQELKVPTVPAIHAATAAVPSRRHVASLVTVATVALTIPRRPETDHAAVPSLTIRPDDGPTLVPRSTDVGQPARLSEDTLAVIPTPMSIPAGSLTLTLIGTEPRTKVAHVVVIALLVGPFARRLLTTAPVGSEPRSTRRDVTAAIAYHGQAIGVLPSLNHLSKPATDLSVAGLRFFPALTLLYNSPVNETTTNHIISTAWGNRAGLCC